MFAGQIDQVLRSNRETAKVFRGVYSRDSVVRVEQGGPLPAAFIVNTAKTDHPYGVHWVLFYLRSGGQRGIYFDSLNEDGSFYPEWQHWFSRQGVRELERNTDRYQALYSDTCAAFCMYVLWFLASGGSGSSLSSILATFGSDYDANEKRVRAFVWRQLGFDFAREVKPLSPGEWAAKTPSDMHLLLADQYRFL